LGLFIQRLYLFKVLQDTEKDPALYEPLGSLWDVMGGNRKGLPVMRLVVRHPNTRSETLAKLADGPNPQGLQPDLVANPNLPPEVLARWLDSTDPTVEYGLASNPKLPQRAMDRLAKSGDRNVRLALTWNPGTPREILDRLSVDADALVARNAAQAIESRVKAISGAR